MNSFKKLRELGIGINPDDIFKILRYLQDSLSQEQFMCLTLHLRLATFPSYFDYDDDKVIWERNLLPRQIIFFCFEDFIELKDV